MGLGEIILGEMGLGEMGLGEMGQNRFHWKIAMTVISSWLNFSAKFQREHGEPGASNERGVGKIAYTATYWLNIVYLRKGAR